MISACRSAPSMDPPFFPFVSSRLEADELDVACPFDQTDNTAATIAGLDLSDPVPARGAAGLSSYVTPTAPMPVAGDLSYSVGTTTRPIRASSHRLDDGRAKKRARIAESPEFEFESVDYWLKFEEEEIMEDNVRQQSEAGPPRRYTDMNTYGQQWSFSETQAPQHPPQPSTFIDSSVFASPSTSLAQPQFGDLDLFGDGLWDGNMAQQDDFGGMNLAEEMARLDSAPPQTLPPPREGLYSTPLSWEQPQLGVTPGQQTPTGPAVLSDAEKRRLLDIALNTNRSSSTFVSSFDLGFGDMVDPWSAPIPTRSIRPSHLTDSPQKSLHNTPSGPSSRPSLSRQTTANTFEASVSTPASVSTLLAKPEKKEKKPGDRSGHNDIERKYRTNLKDKISELRDAVPALRSMMEEGGDDEHRAAKVSKGTVMTKAVEYIRFLERKYSAVDQEHQELQKRIRAFEELMAAATKQTFLMQSQNMPMFDPRNFPS